MRFGDRGCTAITADSSSAIRNRGRPNGRPLLPLMSPGFEPPDPDQPWFTTEPSRVGASPPSPETLTPRTCPTNPGELPTGLPQTAA